MTTTNRSISHLKKVQFLDVVRVHDIKCIDDYTESERLQIWISKDEYSRIRECNRSILQMITNGEQEEEKRGICFRGLEDRDSDGLKQRRYLKREALEMVLYAQEAQGDELMNGCLDWEPIREAYLSVSIDCADAAREVGLSDALQALTAYQKSPAGDVKKLRLSTRKIMQSSPLQHHRSLSHVF